MSKMYEKIKLYYDTGLWSKDRVYNMVKINVLTEEEYTLITGEEYEN